MSIDEMELICNEVFDLARCGVATLDERLQEVLLEVCTLDSEALSCWVRYSSSWAHELPTWIQLLNRVHQELEARDAATVTDLLFGLRKEIK